MNKVGILVASFGSVYAEAVKKSVDALVEDVREEYPDALVEKVFLSDALVEKWNETQASQVLDLVSALQHFEKEGIRDVYIQPMGLVNDPCYQDLRKKISKFLHNKTFAFDYLYVGKPLLSSLGVKNHVDDYELVLEAVHRHIGAHAINKTILLMANGNAQLEYATLQLKASCNGMNHVVVFTANGFPNFKQSLQFLRASGRREVLVVPMAMIGSSHLMDYLGGDRSDSVATLLAEEGYKVSIWNQGFGENPVVRNIFMKHLNQVMRLVERRKMDVTEEVGNSKVAENNRALSVRMIS